MREESLPAFEQALGTLRRFTSVRRLPSRPIHSMETANG